MKNFTMGRINYNRWLSIATLFLLIANIATLTLLWTQNKKQGLDITQHSAPEPVFEFLTKELQLTQQQQLEYRQLRDKHQSGQLQYRDSIRTSKDSLFSLLKQPNVTDSLLEHYSKRATVYDQQLDILTFKHFQQVRALCTPKQQEKFDEIIKDAMRRMGGPRGRRPGPENHPPPGINHEPPPAPE